MHSTLVAAAAHAAGGALEAACQHVPGALMKFNVSQSACFCHDQLVDAAEPGHEGSSCYIDSLQQVLLHTMHMCLRHHLRTAEALSNS
jgi:hypothetical protein